MIFQICYHCLMTSNLDVQKFSVGLNFKRGTFSNIYEGESFILLSQFISKKKIDFLKEKNDELVEFLEKKYSKIQPFVRTPQILGIQLENLLEKVKKWLEKETAEVETNLLFLKLPEEQNGSPWRSASAEPGEIYFSSLGDIKVYLIQDSEIKDLSHKPSIGEKEFSYLTSGNLSGNDILIFATPEIPSFVVRNGPQVARLREPQIRGAIRPIKPGRQQSRVGAPTEASEISEINKLAHLVKKSEGGAILMVKNKSFKELFDEFAEDKKEDNLSRDNLPLDDLSRLEKPKFGFPKLTYLQKSLVVLLIITLLLFIHSLLSTKGKKEIKKEIPEEELTLIQQKEEEVDSKLLVDFELFDKKFLPEKIIGIENHLYTFDPKNNYLYQIDENSGKIFLLSQSSPALGRLNQIFPFDKDSFLVSDEKGIFASYNLLNQELKPIKVERNHEFSAQGGSAVAFGEGGQSIKDFVIYANRLYGLEEKGIYRYRKTADGFGKEEEWLKENFDLKNAKAITIDGDIYILKNNEVFKFYQGKKENFKLEDILPKIKNSTAIFAPLDTNNFYLLEQNRLLIFDKSGKIIKQISSPKFTNLKSFAVSADEKKVWLLESQKIYEAAL